MDGLMASPRVVYGFMHEIITHPPHALTAPRFDRPQRPPAHNGAIIVERLSSLLVLLVPNLPNRTKSTLSPERQRLGLVTTQLPHQVGGSLHANRVPQ